MNLCSAAATRLGYQMHHWYQSVVCWQYINICYCSSLKNTQKHDRLCNLLFVTAWVGILLILLAAPTVRGLCCFVVPWLWCLEILFDHFSVVISFIHIHPSSHRLGVNFHFKRNLRSSCRIKSMAPATLRIQNELLESATLTLFYILWGFLCPFKSSESLLFSFRGSI